MKVHDKNNDTVAYGKNIIFLKENLKNELDLLVENAYELYAKKI